ncbi:MAG: hypothetical protein QOI51_2555 [Nocardioidaceae bacterium]|nr:hypothetical protein [Nocardioidaceae bacterium]
MQPVPGQQHGVDERAGQVQPSAGRLQHPLDEVPHLVSRQDGRGQLVPSVTRNEHPMGFVDPDLLNSRIVEVGLQRSEAGDPRDQLVDGAVGIIDGPHDAGETSLVVSPDSGTGECPNRLDIGQRVDPAPPDLTPYVGVEQLERKRNVGRPLTAQPRRSHPLAVVPGSVPASIYAG